MRIALVSRDFPPKVGGIADHTDLLAASLAARGHDITVVCQPPAETRGAFEVRTTLPNGVVDAVRESAPDAILWQYNPFSIGSRGLATGAGDLAVALAAVAPLTVFFHEIWFPRGVGGLRGAIWARVQRTQGQKVIAAAKACIVTTPERVEELHGRAWRVPVGTNIEPVDETKVASREALGIDPGAFVVAHLGSTGPGRDLGPMSAAAREIGALLYLAGDTGPDVPTGAHVRAPGREDPRRLSLALRAADVYVHSDPVGASAGRRTTLVAALAHGLPVVAYAGPQCAPELSGQITEVARDARDVADALVHLRDSPGERLRSGLRSRQIFDGYFSWRRIAEDVETVLISG